MNRVLVIETYKINLLNDMVITAPVHADTIFSKEVDPSAAIKVLCFFFSVLSKINFFLREEVAGIVSLIFFQYKEKKKRKKKRHFS